LEILIQILILSGSLFVLIKGSDWLIDSSEKIGLSIGISPFIIGVSIVAFGTSLPELASGIAAVVDGNPEIVAGVVVGSNITNILLVLGLVAATSKVINMDYDIMDVDMPLLVGSAFLLWFALRDGDLNRFEALIFLVGLMIFLINSFTSGKKIEDLDIKITWKDILLLILGGVMVKFGADYTVDSITNISEDFNIGSDIIAQTLVALGTSLPEVVVSITAARKGKPGIAVGNVLGSNLFNTFAVMAIPSFFGTLVITEEISNFSIPFMIVATLIFAFISIGGRITKWEGMMLLLFYLFYLNESVQMAMA
jgi:cation:H+ antiporter